jgi:predicted DNA-binding transcriptional regulator YafY
VTGRRGGYVIDKARTLPPLNFTAAEMLAMAVSLAGAQATPFAPALRSALRKVLAAAPAAQTAQAAELADRIRLIGARSAVPLAIQEAIIARHVLRLRYRDRHDVMTCRDVEPVAFAGTRAHWYLVGWCRLRQGTRAFRVDRIHAAADTGEPAPHRSYGDLDVDIPDTLIRRVDLAG